MKSGDGSRDIVNNSAVPRRSSGKDEAALADWRAEHLAVPGTVLEVEIYGMRYPAEVQEDAPLWDPKNERLRA